MSKESSGASGGVGVCTVVGIVFVILKLTKLIDWSWWWVLAPFWIPVALVLVLFIIVFLIKLIEHIMDW